MLMRQPICAWLCDNAGVCVFVCVCAQIYYMCVCELYLCVCVCVALLAASCLLLVQCSVCSSEIQSFSTMIYFLCVSVNAVFYPWWQRAGQGSGRLSWRGTFVTLDLFH